MMQLCSCCRGLSLLALLLLQPLGAWAVLGGSAATVTQDGQPVTSNGHDLSSRNQGLQQQSIVTTQNVTVTEYSAGGVVFAIRWSGPVMPDLSHLLGTYFAQYASNIPIPTAATRNKPITIVTPNLVAHASGHMRAFSGSAYAPGLVPAGLNLATLGVDP
jgi:hypothetical protein